MNQRTRRSPRIPFIAVAKITDKKSGGQLGSRVAELSLNGCYVDAQNTRPVGNEVAIKIFAESACFATIAKVVYEQPNLEMGLAFQEVSLKSGTLLHQQLQRPGDATKQI